MWRQRPQEDLINSKVCSTLSASRPDNYSQHPIYHGTATTCIRHLRTDLPYFHILNPHLLVTLPIALCPVAGISLFRPRRFTLKTISTRPSEYYQKAIKKIVKDEKITAQMPIPSGSLPDNTFPTETLGAAWRNFIGFFKDPAVGKTKGTSLNVFQIPPFRLNGIEQKIRPTHTNFSTVTVQIPTASTPVFALTKLSST